jgi:hypothetical protein
MLTYRGRDELGHGSASSHPASIARRSRSISDYHGRRFAERFPVRTFLLLSEAIDRAAIGTMRAEAGGRRRKRERGDDRGRRYMLLPALQVELHRELQAGGAQSWVGEARLAMDMTRSSPIRRLAERAGRRVR